MLFPLLSTQNLKARMPKMIFVFTYCLVFSFEEPNFICNRVMLHVSSSSLYCTRLAKYGQFLTFNEKNSGRIEAFSSYSRMLRWWSIKRWFLFLEVPQDEQIGIKMTNSMDMPSNILHMKKYISETISKANAWEFATWPWNCLVISCIGTL